MPNINVTDFRQNLAAHLKSVTESRAPLFVSRGKGQGVVVLSEDEYESMAETLHLLSSPANAKHLRESIAQLESGDGFEHDLVDSE